MPILNNEYKVVICWGTKKELHKTLLAYHYEPDYHTMSTVEDETENRRGVTFKQARCYAVIWIDASLPPEEAIGTLAHEATHAVDFTLNDIGETIHHSEVFAHSVGAIVRETLKAMKLLKGKK